MTRQDSNTLADKHLANTREFDKILAELREFTGSIESLVQQAVQPALAAGKGMVLVTGVRAVVDGDLFATLHRDYTRNCQMKFSLWQEDTCLVRDSQYTLRILRRVWNNRGVALELAEQMCACVGCTDELALALERFKG